ncbi:MAG TPA: tyrosine-type recombinase/integrase [Candidatus Acidoferrales bacterium]|nr:tyrosine-type recombinase/integrase [Candidatus Acidoferrales bacterium]
MKKRGNGSKVWEFRYYEPLSDGNGRGLRAVTVGSLQDYPTEAAARKSDAVQAIILRINAEHTLGPITASTVAALIARYESEELTARYSTRESYKSYLDNYIRPRWGEVPIASVRAMAVEDWLKRLTLAPKTRGHIRSLMSTLFKCAQRWELVEANPMQLVRVKNVSKRLERPSVLTAEEFHRLLPNIREPYRTMVLIAGCLGLRASEIVGLQWRDFDFEKSTLLVQRGVVHGRVDDVKTEYSRDIVPIAPELAKELLAYRERCYPTKDGWLFANPATEKPYHQEEIQKKHIRRAAKAAGIKSKVGWKTFRHSFRSWLDQTEAPIGVQRELMRHASIQTTMNVYGRAMTDSKRQAHSNVVQMVLKVESKETAAPSSAEKQEPHVNVV